MTPCKKKTRFRTSFLMALGARYMGCSTWVRAAPGPWRCHIFHHTSIKLVCRTLRPVRCQQPLFGPSPTRAGGREWKTDSLKKKEYLKTKTSNIPPVPPHFSIAGPVMALCESRARNDVVWHVGPGSYTMSYRGPSCGNVVFVGLYPRTDTPF